MEDEYGEEYWSGGIGTRMIEEKREKVEEWTEEEGVDEALEEKDVVEEEEASRDHERLLRMGERWRAEEAVEVERVAEEVEEVVRME